MVPRSLLALTLFATMSCSGDGATTPSEGTEGTPATAEADNGRRDMLVVASQSDIQYLLPVVYESNADSQILQAINMPMIDTEFDCSLKKRPGLADQWEWREDGTVLWLKLREDITWYDGTPVTAGDVAFTYELIADKNVASPRSTYIERMVPGSAPKVIGDYELEFHFKTAYDRDTQVAHASFPPTPRHALADADRATLRGHPFNKQPMVDGPWKVATYEPNNRIVLEPNENFSGPESWKPRLNRVVFKVIPEYSTRLLELQNGTVDFMDGINVADADLLRENNPEISLKRRGWRAMDYVAWNLSNPMFADADVRRALSMSVDVDGMIGKLLTSKTGERYARRAVGTVTPALCNMHNDDIEPLPFDTTAAKELFAKAGWTDSNGDGWLDKDGKTFEFTISTNTGNKRRADGAILLQAAWKDVGVKANIEKLESNTFFDSLRKREYEAALSGWAAALFVDPSDVWHSDDPDRRREFNFTGYSNKQVDNLIERGLKIAEPDQAAPIWREMQQVVYDDQPYLFLWWMDEIVGVHNRFETSHVNILSVMYHLHEWEVPADKVKYQR